MRARRRSLRPPPRSGAATASIPTACKRPVSDAPRKRHRRGRARERLRGTRALQRTSSRERDGPAPSLLPPAALSCKQSPVKLRVPNVMRRRPNPAARARARRAPTRRHLVAAAGGSGAQAGAGAHRLELREASKGAVQPRLAGCAVVREQAIRQRKGCAVGRGHPRVARRRRGAAAARVASGLEARRRVAAAKRARQEQRRRQALKLRHNHGCCLSDMRSGARKLMDRSLPRQWPGQVGPSVVSARGHPAEKWRELGS